MHFLPEAAPRVGQHKLIESRNQHTKQFQNAQQPQRPQDAQVNRNQRLQVKRRHRQEIYDRKRAFDIGKTCIFSRPKLVIFRRKVKTQAVLQREHDHRENVEPVKPVLVRLVNRRDILEQHDKQIDHDKHTDPAVKTLLVVAADRRVKKPGIQPLSPRQIRINGSHLRLAYLEQLVPLY